MRVEKKLRQDMQHSVKVTSKSLFKPTDTEFFVGISHNSKISFEFLYMPKCETLFK